MDPLPKSLPHLSLLLAVCSLSAYIYIFAQYIYVLNNVGPGHF